MKHSKWNFSSKAWVRPSGWTKWVGGGINVAYQIKGNDECSNMVANILPIESPDPRGGIKRPKFFFSEYGHVANHIYTFPIAKSLKQPPWEWEVECLIASVGVSWVCSDMAG